MEDQGKRLLLAVVIAFGIMMVWTMMFPPKRAEEPDRDAAVAEGVEARDGGVAQAGADNLVEPSPSGEVPTSGEKPVEEPAEKPRGEEVLVPFEFDHFRAVFSTYSGGLKTWELRGKKYRKRGGHGQIELAPTGDEDRFSADDVDLYPFVIRFSDASDLQIPQKTEWIVEEQSETGVVFGWESADLHIRKKYRLIPDDFLLELTVEVEKVSEGEAKQELVISSFGYQDPGKSSGSRWTRVDTSWRTACYVSGELETNSVGYLARGPQKYPGRVQWAGFAHSYFLAAFSPRTEGEGQFECIASAVMGATSGTMRVDVVFGPPTKLRQGKAFARTVTAYLGPKYLQKLDTLSKVVGYDTGFEDAVDLGFFAIISRPLLWLLAWFQSFVVNWGVAIILLTLVVKLATLYWTTKSMRSMKAMAELKPEVEKIQKKYKDDKQRQQVEIMAMYKARKVSPLSGCLPMLLQMPIWFALYRTLMVAAELYQAPFISGWIDDLTSPDPYHVLPIALTGMMFLQSKLSPSVADSMQQKLMMYGLPLMFGVFSLFFPAGLTLYIFTNTCLTAVHHVWMNQTDKRRKAATAEPETATRSEEKNEADEGAARDDDAQLPIQGGGNEGTTAPQRKNKGGKQRKRGSQKKKGGRRKHSA